MVQEHEISEIQPPPGLSSFFNGRPPRLWCSGDPRILNGKLIGLISARQIDSDLALKSSQILKEVSFLREIGFASGWHSPLEAEALHILLAQPSRIVVCISKALHQFIPPREIKNGIGEGRILLLTHSSPKARRISREASIRRNELVVGFAAALLVLSAPEGSASLQLARSALRQRKPVLTPEHRMNTQLLASVALPATLENIQTALTLIPEWAYAKGLNTEFVEQNHLRAFDEVHDIKIKLNQADVFDFIQKNQEPADLLIAHAFLDLLPMPESLPLLLSLTDGLAWLTINFDGLTTLAPTIDSALDEQIERLYHSTMDTRPSGGDSRSGRHLFGYLRGLGVEILASGGSDWVVHAVNGTYPEEEAYFLQYVLHFFEESLKGHPELDVEAFTGWLDKRCGQIARGELVYIAHQMDFLVKVGPSFRGR